MGKGGELWDDSALVDAFDRAVATYKEMHGKSNRTTPCEDEKPAAAATAEVEGPIVAEAEDERQEKDDNCDNTSCGLVETPQLPSEERQAVQQVPLQETDPVKETHVSESKTLSSDATDADGNVSSSQQTWEYNELLRQYYELEEKSRNVLQQLQQTNYWNYQASGYASTTQQQQIPAYSATAPDPHSSTTQSSCCYWNVPLVSVSCCSAGQPSEGSACMPPSGGCSVSLTCDQCPGTSTTYPSLSNFVQPPTKLSPNGDQVAKAAMMTAEGALNFMRSTVSGQPGSQKTESETGKEESTSMGMNPNLDITGADSDLAVLLNAWYAAGFYTGRYLARQSTKNSKQ
ncbi:uncharacterized protein LOC120656895 isoform X1 [Panicum virgatum]|uniref:Survival Motor Neuron Gemin2-binding domain-containing protein n=1 Tax=Panicum virgatum TaxID=38727 RepID=A0A8T0X333_PANVG|nr:uncharacterized protein LOC120656895 isoform X1 [Panicum virgatum]KAG2653217.1 hypothetical protein PVAP13_1NG437900 [Panicum virgatum]